MKLSSTLPSLLLSIALSPALSLADDGMASVSAASALTPSTLSLGQTRTLGDIAGSLDEAGPLLEEVVVRAPSRLSKPKPIDASLLRAFREMDRMQLQQQELDWLTAMSNQDSGRLKVGYDPLFEYRFRHADPAPGGQPDINQRPALLRLELN